MICNPACDVLAFARHFFPDTRYTFTHGAEIQEEFIIAIQCNEISHKCAKLAVSENAQICM